MIVSENKINTGQLLKALKAAGEATRLRILALLAERELNVSDLVNILQQSQPRISRHLRLLAEAGLVERFREGSFVYCRLAQGKSVGKLVHQAVALLDPADSILERDRQRAQVIQRERFAASQVWFRANADKWDKIRSLHVAESQVEEAMLDMLPCPERGEKTGFLLDLGTGTGRIIELLADRVEQAIAIDSNHSMLDYARSRLAGPEFEHCQIRQGDIVDLAYGDNLADMVIVHQVLHFLVEPEKAVREAARLLKPGGRLLVVDFAPHDLDFLREKFAHERLGFSNARMAGWLQKAGLVMERHKELVPDGNDDSAEQNESPSRLTVLLWLARKPEQGSRTGQDGKANVSLSGPEKQTGSKK